MNLYKKISLLLLVVFSLGGLNAQDLETGQVEIVKDFNARLAESEKLAIPPSLPPLDTSVQRQTYSIPPKRVTVEYLPPKIRPIAMKRQQSNELYNGYLKLGAGLPNVFYGDLGYTAFVNDELTVGFEANHHSANNTKNIENQRFADNHFAINGSYILEQGLGVNANLDYDLDNVFLYGYNFDNFPTSGIDSTYEADEVKQRFRTFSGGVKVYNSLKTKADFNYSAEVDFYSMLANWTASKENSFELALNGTKWFDERHPFSVTLITDFTSFKDTVKQSLNNFFLQPNFTYHSDAFKVKVGANIASHEDEFTFFPDIELSGNISGSLLTAYVGAEGGLDKNDLHTLTAYNPYLYTRFQLENTNYYHYYGGIKGNIRGIDYQGQLGYKQTSNMPLYISNPDDIRTFSVVYDSVNVFNIRGNISTQLLEDLEVNGSISQNVYTTSSQEKAWHLPALTVNVGARYRMLDDKLLLKGDLFLENGVPYLDKDNVEDNLNALFDISAGAEYQIAEKFGFYIDIYNLAGVKRQRWYRYPTYGLNLMLGVTAKF